LAGVEIKLVHLQPHLGGDHVPERAQIGSGRFYATANRGRIFASEGKKVHHRGLVGVRVALVEQLALAGNSEQRLPWIGHARRDFKVQMVIDIHQPRPPLRAFEVARRPI
jgi:hypothetical protein